MQRRLRSSGVAPIQGLTNSPRKAPQGSTPTPVSNPVPAETGSSSPQETIEQEPRATITFQDPIIVKPGSKPFSTSSEDNPLLPQEDQNKQPTTIHFPFMKLPIELRMMYYKNFISFSGTKEVIERTKPTTRKEGHWANPEHIHKLYTNIFLVSKQVYNEAHQVRKAKFFVSPDEWQASARQVLAHTQNFIKEGKFQAIIHDNQAAIDHPDSLRTEDAIGLITSHQSPLKLCHSRLLVRLATAYFKIGNDVLGLETSDHLLHVCNIVDGNTGRVILDFGLSRRSVRDAEFLRMLYLRLRYAVELAKVHLVIRELGLCSRAEAWLENGWDIEMLEVCLE